MCQNAKHLCYVFIISFGISFSFLEAADAEIPFCSIFFLLRHNKIFPIKCFKRMPFFNSWNIFNKNNVIFITWKSFSFEFNNHYAKDIKSIRNLKLKWFIIMTVTGNDIFFSENANLKRYKDISSLVNCNIFIKAA